MKTIAGLIQVTVGLVLLTAMGGCANKRQPPPQDARAVTAADPAVAQSEGESCGQIRCEQGQVCCNASCGICTPPGGMCTQQFCEPQAPVDQRMNPDGQAHKGPAAEGSCKDDADCRAVSDYCTGCDCRALGPKQALADCAGPGVRCLKDPCAVQVAVCIQGYCQLQPQS